MNKSRKYTALIIDDQATSRVIMSHIVQGVGDNIVIEESESSKDAMSWCDKNQADIILIDYMMPELNGLDFIKEIRKNKNYNSVPIIMVTSMNDNRIKYAALDAGVTDFLLKPVDVHECHARCRNLFTLRTQYLELEDLKTPKLSIVKN